MQQNVNPKDKKKNKQCKTIYLIVRHTHMNDEVEKQQ